MSNKKYGFVILHYLAYDMTVECIENIINNYSNNRIKIAVVDNASPNGSGKKLYDKYKNSPIVSIILNHTNEGFAKGNNLGYDHIKRDFEPDYIIVMNNDVIIEQPDFLDEIDHIYQRTDFAVLGPDIYNPAENKHQNPAHLKGFTKEEMIHFRERLQNYCKHPAYHYYKHLLLGGIKEKIKGKPIKECIDISKEQSGIVLHGACYIFSKNFIDKRGNCFCPDTFLYMEEDILHYECSNTGLKMVYSPSVKVNHLEDVATNASIKSKYKKAKMKNYEILKSVDVFLKLYDDSEGHQE